MKKASRQASLRRERGPNWVHESPLNHIAWNEDTETEDSTEEQTKPMRNRKRKRGRGSGEKGQGGAHSLKYLAMRRFVADQREIDKETFRNVPWMLAIEIWDCLGRWYVVLYY